MSTDSAPLRPEWVGPWTLVDDGFCRQWRRERKVHFGTHRMFIVGPVVEREGVSIDIEHERAMTRLREAGLR